LVRDHEELEARIDAAAMYLRSTFSIPPPTREAIVTEVARLLKGGARIPNDISEIEGSGG
jgi:hypothetical protein